MNLCLMLGNPSTYIQPGHRKAILWLPDGRKSSYRCWAATGCPSTAKMPPKRLGRKASVGLLRMRLADVSIGAFLNGALEQAVMAMTKGRRICRICLTLELSGGVAVRLERNVRRQHAAPPFADTIALLSMPGNAAQLVACERRTNRWRQTPRCDKPRAPRSAKKTRCDNARKTQRTTKRTKGNDAGRPGATQRALQT